MAAVQFDQELIRNPPVLREFLYADIERVQSLLAQLLGGVPEEDRSTESVLRHRAVGMAKYLGVGRESRVEEYEQRSLIDALFPALEDVLESEGWLTDISEEIDDASDKDLSRLESRVPAGAIVRLTAPGHLFDAEYVAKTLAGAAVAIDGVTDFQKAPPDAARGQGRSAAKKPSSRPPGQRNVPGPGRLEDIIEDFAPDLLGEAVTASMFRSLVRVSRGLFPTGLHLLMESGAGAPWSVVSRLERDQRYLDSETDILFSRYGVDPLDWTIVGHAGHWAKRTTGVDLAAIPTVRNGRAINRTGLISVVNGLMSEMAAAGLSSSPAHPGFSIVPIAVYRIIPHASQE